MSEEEARKIERETIKQNFTTLWYALRRYRLTTSSFGQIFRRKSNTPPGALVLSLLSVRQISQVIHWGIQQEMKAIEAYKKHQNDTGHSGLTACPVGFISFSHLPLPWSIPRWWSS